MASGGTAAGKESTSPVDVSQGVNQLHPLHSTLCRMQERKKAHGKYCYVKELPHCAQTTQSALPSAASFREQVWELAQDKWWKTKQKVLKSFGQSLVARKEGAPSERVSCESPALFLCSGVDAVQRGVSLMCQ